MKTRKSLTAPGDPAVANVATFGGPRLLFNIDNDPNAANNGVNDIANMSAEGLGALLSAIDFASPLTAVPEPSAALLGLLSLGLIARRRRQSCDGQFVFETAPRSGERLFCARELPARLERQTCFLNRSR